MASQILLPRLGWTMEEAIFVEWLKSDGDTVAVGEPLFSVETDKATHEVEAADAGVLRLATGIPKAGETLLVGAVLGFLVAPGEEVTPEELATIGTADSDVGSGPGMSVAGMSGDGGSIEASAPIRAASAVPPPAAATGAATPSVRGPTISPRAARLASELGVDWTTLRGSGRTGRIRARDVLDAGKSSSALSGAGLASSPAPLASAFRIAAEKRMRSHLEGTVSLVTGSQRGIGQAIADRLAENGSVVIYSDVDLAGAKEAARAYSHCRGVELDVTRPDQIRAVVERIFQEHGRLDILVNNAGVNTLEHRVTIEDFPREEWDRIIAVDLTGLYEMTRATARVMRAQGGGRIINIASIVGLVPLRLQCAFAAAKAGVVNLTRSTAIELGPHGILVNGIAPGSTLTEGTRQLFYGEGGKFSDSVQRMLDHVPLGRPATTNEIAVAAQFLADPENTYMNGHILTVDGGWTAGYTRDF